MCLFRPPSLMRTSFLDGFRIARLFRGLYSGADDLGQHLEKIPAERLIARLEVVRQRNPKDWLVRYLLGDWYCRARKYGEALTVLQEAYELRPRDPRSTYALATVYRALSNARFTGVKLEEIFAPEDLEFILTAPVNFDPIASANELESLGMTVDDVAQKAMEYFEETLRLGVRRDEKKQVRASLEKMYTDFPHHLEMKVKAQRRSDTSLLGDAREGSAGILNEAVSHYTRLRYLLDRPARFRFELGEVIRLCQWTIAIDSRQGDAYVLLANAYSLFDSHVASIGLEPHYYLRWAAAIIQHWADTPLSQYPFTKNTQIGRTLYENIVSQIIRENVGTYEQVVNQMKEWSKLYLQEALSPTSFATIREQLNAEQNRT